MSQSDEPRPEEPDDARVSAEETPTEETAPDTAAEPSPAAGTGNRKVLLISAAAVVVLVVAGVVVYLLTRDDSSGTAGAPGVPSIENPDQPSSVGPARPPGGVTATITAPSSSPSPSPAAGGEAGAAQDVAEQAAQAITDADLKTLGELSCDPDAVNPEDDTFPADAKVEVVGNPQVNGDTATVDVKVVIADAPPATVPMPLVKQDGRWCILN